MSYHRCPKCASNQVMDGAFVADAQGPRVVVGVSRHPDHGALETTVSTQVHASVCGSCGYVELWANRPGELWDVYHAAELRARSRASGEAGEG